jgi:hypothetical protein
MNATCAAPKFTYRFLFECDATASWFATHT